MLTFVLIGFGLCAATYVLCELFESDEPGGGDESDGRKYYKVLQNFEKEKKTQQEEEQIRQQELARKQEEAKQREEQLSRERDEWYKQYQEKLVIEQQQERNKMQKEAARIANHLEKTGNLIPIFDWFKDQNIRWSRDYGVKQDQIYMRLQVIKRDVERLVPFLNEELIPHGLKAIYDTKVESSERAHTEAIWEYDIACDTCFSRGSRATGRTETVTKCIETFKIVKTDTNEVIINEVINSKVTVDLPPLVTANNL